MTHNFNDLAEKFLSAWNSQNSAEVLSVYSNHFTYKDPNTQGTIANKESFGRYLDKLFQSWDMHYLLKECLPIVGKEGATVIWQASFKKRGHTESVEIIGMDVVLFENDLVIRNDVFFDRMALIPIAAPILNRIQKLQSSGYFRRKPLIKDVVQFGEQIKDSLPGELKKGRTFLVEKRNEVMKFIGALRN